MKTAFKTEGNKPFALLQVPPAELAGLVENPDVIQQLKDIIGVDVLIIGEDVHLWKGEQARDQVEKIHDEIERFLDQPKPPEDMTEDELAAEIHRLVVKHRDLEDPIGKLRQMLAERTCPYKVGDVLVDDKGNRAVVSRISPHTWRESGKAYSMRGRYIRKDGSEGKRTCYFYEWDNWHKEGEVEEGNEAEE